MNMRVVAVYGLPTPQGLRAGHVLLISRFGVRVPGGALAGSPCSVRTSGFLVALSVRSETGRDAPTHAPKTQVRSGEVGETHAIWTTPPEPRLPVRLASRMLTKV